MLSKKQATFVQGELELGLANFVIGAGWDNQWTFVCVVKVT